eukprot:TRINITY_DN1203_c0_g1_i1.p1 TRINITY_DN1203_c0_g1~~TRINITY_DN1203_c0_g1_i1.p1  ORF type:complete len:543 (+),score=102.75 TRINITY_DN1203_c0_g1_i1:52-1629(+)
MKTALSLAAAVSMAGATLTTVSSVPFVGEGLEVFGSINSISQVKDTSVISAGTGGNVIVEATYPSQNPATVELTLPMTAGATKVYDHYYGGIFHFSCQGEYGVQAYFRNPPSIFLSGHYQPPPGMECRSIAPAHGQMNMVGTHFTCIKWTSLSEPSYLGSIALPHMANKIVALHPINDPKFAYVSMGVNGLVVVDHNNPASPFISASFGPAQSLNCDIRDMILMDNRLIIANGAYGIRVYDITNPGVIVFVGDYTGFHSSPITSVTVPFLPGSPAVNHRMVAAAPGDRLYILDPVTFAVLEDDVQYSDIEKVSANQAQRGGNNAIWLSGTMDFVGIGSNIFKNIQWDKNVILPPAPGCVDGVEIGQTLSGSTVTGHTMPLSGTVQLEGIPQFLIGSELFAPTLPVPAQTDITLSCCGTSTCEFFITIFRCLGCTAAASDLPAILVTEKWESGSCAPKFTLNGGSEQYGMATFHKQFQPGEIVTLPQANMNTQYMAVFKHTTAPQPWCAASSNRFVGAQRGCTCPP